MRSVGHRLRRWRHLLGVLELCATACGQQDPSAVEACTALARVPLLHGSPDSGSLDLSSSQTAAIGALRSPDGDPICTATVIAPDWAVTAAHCDRVENRFASSSAAVEPRRVCSSVKHPSLDVMLIRLSAQSAEPCISGIPLLETQIDASWQGKRAVLAGVGLDESGEVGRLRFVEETIHAVHDDELWVDGEGRSGACVGDSGGPLLIPSSSSGPRLAGVLDRGSRDCLGTDVYIRSDVLFPWISEQIESDPASYCPK